MTMLSVAKFTHSKLRFQSFIDHSLAAELNILLILLPDPLPVSALNGFVLVDLVNPVWPPLKNPNIDWQKNYISGWSLNCYHYVSSLLHLQ